MTRPATRRLLLAATLATGLLLAGCDQNHDGIDDQTGKPVTVAQPVADTSTSGGCDPHGFGPLSGCHGAQQPTQRSRFVPDPGVDAAWIKQAAIHEAGHEAVAEEQGRTVDSVTIYPDGSGQTFTTGGPTDQLSMVTRKVAGRVAAGTLDGADKDYSEIADLLADLPPTDADRVVREAEGIAARIVAKRAGQIDTDAAELVKYGSLS